MDQVSNFSVPPSSDARVVASCSESASGSSVDSWIDNVQLQIKVFYRDDNVSVIQILHYTLVTTIA